MRILNNVRTLTRSPVPEQPQTPPGLASEMQPVPDHGETSYKGHGRPAGKSADYRR